MRLESLPVEATVDLLHHALLVGVRHFHSSIEYDSFKQFSTSLTKACNRAEIAQEDIEHTVKLAEPNFNQTGFKPANIRETLDQYLNELKINQVHTVQWMLRGDLTDHGKRYSHFKSIESELRQCVSDLKKNKSISKFTCFPYSSEIRKSLPGQDWCDGLIDYVNPLETDASSMSSTLRDDQTLIGIRPFLPLTMKESELKNPLSFSDLVNHLKSVENLEAVIASSSSKKHLNQIVSELNSIDTVPLD